MSRSIGLGLVIVDTVDKLIDETEALIATYWDLAYAEGKAGVEHDTQDHRAATTLASIEARLQILRQMAYRSSRLIDGEWPE